jgi:hypothetical protein
VNTEVLLALLIKKVEERLESLPDESPLRGPRGPRGQKGETGKDFSLEENSEQLKSWAKEFSLKFSDFTAEQIELLKGPRGERGPDGRAGKDFSLEENEEYFQKLAEDFAIKFEDLSPEQLAQLKGQRGERGPDGRAGKDFSLEENKEYFQKLAEDFSIKFEDFTSEQIELLRGHKGDSGKDGRGFDFSEHREEIQSVITEAIKASYETLKLSFSDLTVEDIEQLRGPRGRDGRDGKDFNLEEHKEFFNSLKPKFSDFTPEEINSLRLHFSDLTDEEKSTLKLRFEDLTEEDRQKIKGDKGARGQKGSRGQDGESIVGPMGKQGPRGLPGPIGPRGVSVTGPVGKDGADGKNGKDAPYITDITVDQYKQDEAEFVFEFSDGTELRTNPIKIPRPNVYTVMGGGGGSSGGSGSGGGLDLDEFGNKFKFHVNSLSAYDKVVSVTYHDEGLRTQRVDEVTMSSTLYPDTDVVKKVYWLGVGTLSQRIEKIEYVGGVFTPDSIRKVFQYALSGTRYRVSGFNYELF